MEMRETNKTMIYNMDALLCDDIHSLNWSSIISIGKGSNIGTYQMQMLLSLPMRKIRW